MKKTLLIAVIAFAITSCKKNYTCTCTSTGGGTTSSVSVTVRDTKKNAKAECEQPPTSNGLGSTTTCKID